MFGFIMNPAFNILKYSSISDTLTYRSGLPILWITLTWRQNKSNGSLFESSGAQKQYVFEHFALRGFISEITVFYSQCCQWPYTFLYLISHLSLSMIHLLRLHEQPMTPYNQEMTNIIKGHDSCNDTDAGLLVRSSFFPTQLPVRKGHSFQCQRGILVRICRPQDVLHRVNGKSKGLPPVPCYFLSHLQGTKILNFNLQLTKHSSWCFASEKSGRQSQKIPLNEELTLTVFSLYIVDTCCHFALHLSVKIQQIKMYSLRILGCIMFTSSKKKSLILKWKWY